MIQIKSILANLGFDNKEIEVYNTLLRNGSVSALQIAKESGIDRTTVYDVLNKLIQKGIVSSILKNNTTIFSGLTPDKLVLYFKDKYSTLEKMLPELKKISNQAKEQVKCELFQGKEGLKNVSRDLIESKKNYKVIGMRHEYDDVLSYFLEHSILVLDELKIKETAIVEKSASFKKLKQGNYRYLDKKLLSPITTLIYGNTVVFFIWIEPYFAIRIENTLFAQAQKEYFDLLWNIAEP